MAATGNVAHYIATKEKTVWKYDFQKLTNAAWIFYSSISVIPIAVWFALGHLSHTKQLVEVISLYGYSLFIFIPTSVICVLPLEWLRWTSVVVSFVVSSTFIVRNLGNLVIIRNPEQNRSTKTKGYILLSVILACHLGIAVLMKFYFFHYD
jgi:protein YIPF1/2